MEVIAIVLQTRDGSISNFFPISVDFSDVSYIVICHWNFSLTKSYRSHCGPGVDSDSNRNEYQEHFLGVKAAGA